MAKQIRTKNGKVITLLNPAERGRKYAKELHTGVDVYTGEALSPRRKAFRSGYLKARRDSARAFKAKHPSYQRRTNTKFK